MSPLVRVLVIALLQFVLIFFAGWFAFNEDALGPGVHSVSRIGVVLLCLVLVVVISELSKMRTHFGVVIRALRATQAGASVPEAVGPTLEQQADPRAAVDILLQALASEDPDTREKAHKHLVRLTGKELPPEIALWQRWWQENRGRFPGPEGA